MGALPDGRKELVAVWDGFRESTNSWLSVLRELRQRGLEKPPALAVGDGALGFWAAFEEVFPTTRRQRCWVHKTANILDTLPKKVQPHAKQMIHEMYMAPTRKDARAAYQAFLNDYGARYPKACECLEKDFECLFTFYRLPGRTRESSMSSRANASWTELRRERRPREKSPEEHAPTRGAKHNRGAKHTI